MTVVWSVMTLPLAVTRPPPSLRMAPAPRGAGQDDRGPWELEKIIGDTIML